MRSLPSVEYGTSLTAERCTKTADHLVQHLFDVYGPIAVFGLLSRRSRAPPPRGSDHHSRGLGDGLGRTSSGRSWRRISASPAGTRCGFWSVGSSAGVWSGHTGFGSSASETHPPGQGALRPARTLGAAGLDSFGPRTVGWRSVGSSISPGHVPAGRAAERGLSVGVQLGLVAPAARPLHGWSAPLGDDRRRGDPRRHHPGHDRGVLATFGGGQVPHSKSPASWLRGLRTGGRDSRSRCRDRRFSNRSRSIAIPVSVDPFLR